MKFTVTMKDPDTLQDAIEDAVTSELRDIPLLNDEERAACAEIRMATFSRVASKWFEYGEYLRVEIDTDAQTCVVVEV